MVNPDGSTPPKRAGPLCGRAAGRISAPGGVAQLVERCVRNAEVGGSNPLASTVKNFLLREAGVETPCRCYWSCGSNPLASNSDTAMSRLPSVSVPASMLTAA